MNPKSKTNAAAKKPTPVDSFFVENLRRVVARWPDGVEWSLVQLASYTSYETQEVAEWLSAAAGTVVSEDDRFSRDFVEGLTDKLADHAQKVSDDEKLLRQRNYDQMRKSIVGLQQAKNWHGAYQTLTYFLGERMNEIDESELFHLYDECLRLGCKAKVNPVDLGQWFYKCLELAKKSSVEADLEHIHDMLDAYQEYFESIPQGKKVLSDIQLASSWAPK